MYAYCRGPHPKMPVVCFCEEDSIDWVADGAALDARGKRGLNISPGANLERDMTRANGSMHDILKFLAAAEMMHCPNRKCNDPEVRRSRQSAPFVRSRRR